jgi:hypothetical protein
MAAVRLAYRKRLSVFQHSKEARKLMPCISYLTRIKGKKEGGSSFEEILHGSGVLYIRCKEIL